LLEGDKVTIITPAPGYQIEIEPSVQESPTTKAESK